MVHHESLEGPDGHLIGYLVGFQVRGLSSAVVVVEDSDGFGGRNDLEVDGSPTAARQNRLFAGSLRGLSRGLEGCRILVAVIEGGRAAKGGREAMLSFVPLSYRCPLLRLGLQHAEPGVGVATMP